MTQGVAQCWHAHGVQIIALSLLLATAPACSDSSTTDPPPQTPQNVNVNPGDDLQSLVSQYAPGSTFFLAPGLYRQQSIVPKDGNTFTGQPGTILSGAVLLSSFTQSGAYWVADVQATPAASYPGFCNPAHPNCLFPEDLFFDDVPKTRASNLSALGTGQWYLDYTAGKAYMADNPVGHKVEISLTPHAFTGPAHGVTFSNLVVEKYASVANDAAIYGWDGADWTLTACEVRYNHALGIRTGNGMTLKQCYAHHNGQFGFGGQGDSVLLDHCRIAFNNYAGYNYYWGGGGAKFTEAQHLTIQYCNSHDNFGPGLETDAGCRYVLYDHNTTSNNIEVGILHETGYDATISNNSLTNDGFNADGTNPWWGSGIYVNTSSNVEVENNTLVNCMNGITGRLDDRGNGANGQPYTLQNLSVHDNTITQTTGMACALVKGPSFDNSVYTSYNNHFQNNTFNLADPATYDYFYWLGQPWTLAQWNQYSSLH